MSRKIVSNYHVLYKSGHVGGYAPFLAGYCTIKTLEGFCQKLLELVVCSRETAFPSTQNSVAALWSQCANMTSALLFFAVKSDSWSRSIHIAT